MNVDRKVDQDRISGSMRSPKLLLTVVLKAMTDAWSPPHLIHWSPYIGLGAVGFQRGSVPRVRHSTRLFLNISHYTNYMVDHACHLRHSTSVL